MCTLFRPKEPLHPSVYSRSESSNPQSSTARVEWALPVDEKDIVIVPHRQSESQSEGELQLR